MDLDFLRRAGHRLRQGPWTAPLLKLLAVFYVVFVDPFGLKAQSDDYFQAAVTQVTAPFYGRGGQDHVSAIVVTDEAAERIAGSYPMPFGDHARILRRILCLDPAAVFVDVNFRYVRGNEADLTALVEALSYRVTPEGCDQLPPERLRSEAVAPVLLAIIRNERSACPSWPEASGESCAFMQPLKALGAVARPVDISGLLHNGRYLLANPTFDGQRIASPAVRLVDALCRRGEVTAAVCKADKDALVEPLIMRWGYFLSPLTRSHYALGPCDGTPSDQVPWVARLSRALHQLLAEVTDSLTGRTADRIPVQPCPYTDHVTADAFLSPDVNSDPFLRRLVKGRAVVYGASITALPDRVVSPVHGAVPGLYAHATATDNLLTQGDRYWRDPPKVIGSLDAAAITEFLLSALFIGLGAFLTRRAASDVGRARKGLRRFYIGFGLVIVGVAAAFVCVWSLAPVNALVLFGILFLAGPPIFLCRGHRSPST